MSTSDWMPRVLFESFLIVISILVALALDEWRDQRADDETVRQSLQNFVSEIRQNRARVEDAAPFNQGLKNVLASHYVDDDIASVDDGVIDGNQTVAITASAPEYNEGRDTFIVTDTALPDLVLTRVETPATGYTGDFFNVTYREENHGLSDASGE